MKPLVDQDHYQILEVPRDAGPQAIEKAYRLQRATYSDESIAVYSLMDEGDVEVLRERIELAWRVLSNEASRREYDATLEARAPESGSGPEPAAPDDLGAPAAMDAFEDEEEESGVFDGARLRRARLRRGLELDQISRTTKIKPEYLRRLEEDRFDELPAAVYVRGFVGAYAACVGLDPRRAAAAYTRRLEEHRGGERSLPGR